MAWRDLWAERILKPWASKLLLFLGLGLFLVGWALQLVAYHLGADGYFKEIALVLPYLGFLTLLLAGICAVLCGFHWAARSAVRPPHDR